MRGAPQVDDARIVPGNAVLVGIGRVVLLGHVVAEQDVRQRLEAVRVDAGDVDRGRVVVADVLGERLAGRPVEDDDAGRSLEADEEVVLAALVVVQAADHAPAREAQVRLARRLREQRLAPELRRASPARPRSGGAAAAGGPSITGSRRPGGRSR